MPQNFNITPYNDDFNEQKHFYRILFRPSVAVQARELTQAQTILQQQIKNLGDSIYKHGSMVIPGQVATDPKTHYVRLKPTYGFIGNTPIPINLLLFKNQVIEGQTSGLKAQVVYTVAAVNTDSPTVYVKYLNTGTNGETVFASGEVLTIENSSNGLANVEDNAPTGLAISAQIDEGIYYIWGFFVRVEKQYLLLNKYSNIVSARVGLQIVESIVTPEEDFSLNDNAQGTPNYAAPGAHRYKIDLVLSSKDINDTTTDQNFVELVRLINSVTQSQVVTDTYTIILKEMAQRMADANGDFAVRNFQIDVRESLNTAFVTAGVVTGATVEVPPTPGPAAAATISLATSASAVNDAYKNFQIYLNNGSGAGQTFIITSYNGSTKTAFLDQDYKANQVADTTTTYAIYDPTKVNRGVYPPAPADPDNPPPGYPLAPYGDIDKLAVGLESGRAYVDGYRIDTLATSYVEMDKARDSAQAQSSIVSTPIGTFLFVKNLTNFPLPTGSAGKDFLKINFSNHKSVAGGSFNPTQNGLGTARVHSIEFFSGATPDDPNAVFKMYIFDINLNPGVDINSVRSFHLINDVSHNNLGYGNYAQGDVCTVFSATNINGTGLVPGATITGPSGSGTELLVSYDPISNNIFTEPNSTNGLQILISGQFTAPNNTTGTLSSRTQMLNAAAGTLIYELPQRMVKTVRASDSSIHTTYYLRQMFEAQRNNSGQYIFNAPNGTSFAPFNTTDYLACVVSDTVSANVGKVINLGAYVNQGSIVGSPAGTQLQFAIMSGVGSSSGCILKLMATLQKTAASEKLKALTTTQIAVAHPTGTISLQEADIVTIERVYDSGNANVAVDTSTYNTQELLDAHYTDIKSRYAYDTGQRDYFYDVGTLIKYPAAPDPTGQILIVFKYFAHSGNGDYFSVDSYANQTDYASIPFYKGSNGKFYALRDCMDFRPRKDNQQFGFNGTGSSYSSPLLPSGNATVDFQYYLPRIDKIYLDQYGRFNVIKGTSTLNPSEPLDPLDGMMLYTVKLNAYTLSTTDLKTKPTKNPRYTMHDIGKLEQRIANLEYYTNLNQLETQTASYSITDTSTGLDRFKNGFVVDNFTGHTVGNITDPDYACAIDPTSNTLRPLFIQDNNAMVFQADKSSGYVLRANMLILPYTETPSIEQKFATDIVNVNPFAVFAYYGDIALIPATDTWKSTVQLPAINVDDRSQLKGYTLNQWSQVTWGDWQTTWVGDPVTATTSTVTQDTDTTQTGGGGGGGNPNGPTITQQQLDAALADPNSWVFNGGGGPVNIVYINGAAYATGPEWVGQQPATAGGAGGSTTTTTNTTTTTTTTTDTTQQIGQTRTGLTTQTVAQLASQRINNSIIDVSTTPYIRSRRIKVIGRHFKPNTRLYPFFDGIAVSSFCRPFSDPQITPSLAAASWTMQTMKWGGDFDPQVNGNSGASTDPTDVGFSATLLTGPLNDPIMTDSLGTCTLFFEIPSNNANLFRVGLRPFRLTSSPTNGKEADAYGDANYNASGLLQQNQETITSIYTPQTVTKQVDQSQVITQDLGSTSTSTSTVDSTSTTTGGGAGGDGVVLWMDPLAQSILIKENGGCFVTSIDVYFQTMDQSVPITMQIRSMVNGYPSQEVVPFGEKVLYPNNPTLSAVTAAGTIPDNTIDPLTPTVINVSDDALQATRFVFDSPVFLHDSTEYAFVLISNSIKYNVYTAKIGGTVVGSTNIVSSPPYLGSIFKSQNASTWVADPSQNMKFSINKAQYDPTNPGTLYFVNSAVQEETLLSLPFQTVNGSNRVRVYHKNHQMPKGEHSFSYVLLSNIAPGTYNGLSDVQLTGTFPIDNVDLHSYTITVPGAAAIATGRVGPDAVVATSNIQFDSMCPMVNQLTPTGTTVDWSALFTSGKSPNNNPLASQEPYFKDTTWTPLTPNATMDFGAPRMIASTINETLSIVGATPYDRKSLVVKAVLSTTNKNLTPIVDLTRVSMVLIGNQIDDPTFANYTLADMDQGKTITSTGLDPMNFQSQVLLSVIAVTGGQYTVVDGNVIGQTSGANGTVVSWDGSILTLSDVVGVFQANEAVSQQHNSGVVVGTLQSFEYLNTITNPTKNLDFSVFIPGYGMTISGLPLAQNQSTWYTYDNPVYITGINGNQITVATDTPFPTFSNQANIQLTQYVRFVVESGPNNCTTTSRYITKQFNLANAANSLRVVFTINRPPGAFVDAYYRVLMTNSTQPFDTLIWKKMTLDTTVDDTESSNPKQFKDYTYTADNIGKFTAFSIKLVLRGGNSSRVPKIKSFRGIALAV
jgi:hypothetical protein